MNVEELALRLRTLPPKAHVSVIESTQTLCGAHLPLHDVKRVYLDDQDDTQVFLEI